MALYSGPRHDQHVPEWSDLSERDQQVLMLASEEGMLWEIYASLEPDPARRQMTVITAVQDVVGRLARNGLLWFHRLTVGADSPDLTDEEVEGLFGDPTAWVRNENGDVSSVAIHLTPAGERIY